MINLEDAINALFDYYREFSLDKPLDYTFGFFDAIGVLRDYVKSTNCAKNA